MGNVIQAGNKMNPARQAAINGGVPVDTPAMTVNRVCGSGAQAIASAAQEVMFGFINGAVAGGMENMDRAPYLMSSGRWGYRMGDGQIFDAMLMDGLNDAFLVSIPDGTLKISRARTRSPAKSRTAGRSARRNGLPLLNRPASSLQRSRRWRLPPAKGQSSSTETSTIGRILRWRSLQLKPAFRKMGRSRPAMRPALIPGRQP